MSLETATFTDELDVNNPVSTDNKSQGDNHLRLIKSTIKNSLKRVTRAFYVPSVDGYSGTVTAVAGDDNKLFSFDTTGTGTLNLPSLSLSDKGWSIYVMKATSDANPVFIVPPSGTINGFSKIRRAVQFGMTKVIWLGATWVASRPVGHPIGSVIDFHGSSLPSGYLWPDGTTFTAADYVELNSVLGGNTKPDYRGRVGVGKDNLGGSDSNRITSGGCGIDGNTLGDTGGSETHTLTEAQLASHTHANTASQASHTHTADGGSSTFVSPFDPAVPARVGSGNGTTGSAAPAITVTNVAAGGGQAHNNVQPSIISNKILVAE